MPASMFDQLLTANKSFPLMEPLLALNNMTMRLYGDVAKEQAKVMNELMRCHMEQFQQMKYVKSWEDMMAIQADWANKASTPLNDYRQSMINACMSASADYAKWLQKGFKQEESLKEGFKEEKALPEKIHSQAHRK